MRRRTALGAVLAVAAASLMVSAAMAAGLLSGPATPTSSSGSSTPTSGGGDEPNVPSAGATIHAAPSTINTAANSNGLVVFRLSERQLLQLLGTPRDFIEFTPWCWNIDPRPPECDIIRCGWKPPSPVVPPLCPREIKFFEEGDGDQAVQLKYDRAEVGAAAGDACGDTEFLFRAMRADGTIGELKGTIRLIDPPACM